MSFRSTSNPTTYQPTMKADGQAVNKGNLLSGLRRESQVNANTGTATGNRAVQDFAKAQLYSNQAGMGRAVDKQNAEVNAQRQQQKQQLLQQGQQQRLQRYQQAAGQRVDQMSLATQIQQNNIEMWSQWQNALVGLLD